MIIIIIIYNKLISETSDINA